jgi:bifunctional enzyme CysN/CysC
MLVKPDNLPRMERHFEAMLVWMDEEPMDLSVQYFLKHTSNTTRSRIDVIRYKVDVNTLEKSEIEKLTLNEIGRGVITTAKTLFFDPYKKNKNTGSFVLIHPVTNNTVAVGMILDKLESKDLPSRITDIDKETSDLENHYIQPKNVRKNTIKKEKQFGLPAFMAQEKMNWHSVSKKIV